MKVQASGISPGIKVFDGELILEKAVILRGFFGKGFCSEWSTPFGKNNLKTLR